MDRKFNDSVALTFKTYNGLFLSLPFKDSQKSAVTLPLFTEHCKNGLKDKNTPIEIVESFIQDSDPIDSLFSFLRLVERQVVLFDAIEDGFYSDLHDLNGAGSIQDVLNQLEGKEDRLRDFIDKYIVRVVLTAHPTQFYTDQVLGIASNLSKSLKENNITDIYTRLLQLGKTRLKRKEKPTPLNEAESLLSILKDVMYKTLPVIHEKIVNKSFKNSSQRINQSSITELGFWPGGDRDGNPFVDGKTTIRVSKLLKRSILKKYLKEIKDLKFKLTFDGVYEIVEEVERRILNSIDKKSGYKNKEELLKDLIFLRESVSKDHMNLYIKDIDRFIYKVQCFGFHFASIDVRQDSTIHDSLMTTILPKLYYSLFNTHFSKNYIELQEDEKVKLLLDLYYKCSNLNSSEKKRVLKGLIHKIDNPTQRDVLESIIAIRYIQKHNGLLGAHRYIISNSQTASDILEVWFLASLSDSLGGTIDIVPLFETIDDLHNAEDVMDILYSTKAYSEHLKLRDYNQHIMLGFSDGTKDGGYVAANWEIYKAKKTLTKVSKKHNIRPLFFDGRGGPPARGGGNTHRFYRSLEKNIDSSAIQLTIQGQTITSTYGTVDSATHNLEQLVSAGVENDLTPEQSADNLEEIMDTLSKLALDKYLELKRHPQFLPYLETITPLSYYSKTNIGSRPSKRSSKGPLTLSSLRAIPFVGAWSQMKQNVPGFYGFGTALNSLIELGKLSELQQLYKSNLFFSTLIDNSMQSLAKSNFQLTSYIDNDREFSDIWNQLKIECELTIKTIKQVANQNYLLESDSLNRESIIMREDIILPVLVIQQYALQKLRENNDSNREAYEKLIIKGLAASVNASRNSV